MSFWTIVSSVEFAYLVTLAVIIVLEKRSPVATLAWILVLATLPIVGLVIWFTIGPRRLHRKRLRHAKSRVLVREHASTSTSRRSIHEYPWKDQLVRLVTKSSGAPLMTCREVKVLINGKTCFDAIVEAIGRAKNHVHLEYYIFEDDETGGRIRDALVERAKNGVRVRLLVDAVGSPLGYRFRTSLSDAHIEFARFNPLMFIGSLRPRVNFRSHRKIVVIDGDVGFVGGINIGDDYNEGISGPSAYRDTHLRIRGSAVRELQLAFLEDWHFATGKMLTREHLFAHDDPAEDELVQIIASGPDQDWQSIQQLFFAAITQAEKRIEITTPYFVPDEAIFTALVTAAMRGVDIHILVPRRSDSRIVSAAARSYYDDLLRAGAHIWEFPKMIHAKTMVVDHKMGIVGSANMDNRSFRLNFEIGATFFHAEAVTALERQFAADLELSHRVTSRARHKLDVGARLFEASARLLSPLL
jgi:cardiolipin synthase